MKFFYLFYFLLLSLPGFSQEDDERTLRELEAQRAKQTEVAVKLDQTSHKIADQTVQSLKNLKKIAESGVKEFDILKKEDREELKKVVNQNMLGTLPRDLVRSALLDKVKGTPLEKVFELFPKLLDVIVDLARDKEAMLGIIGIVERSEDIKLFAYICIGLTICALIVRKLFIPKNGSWVRRALIRLGFNVAILSMNFGVFYTLFEQELGPVIAILKKHF